jgi:Fe-S-cluster containining protein
MEENAMLPVETDLTVIQQCAQQNEDENWNFRAFLKGREIADIDQAVHQLYRQIASQIDCTTCGNCCNVLHVVVTQDDMAKLSQHLGLSHQQFVDRYVCEDKEEEGWAFRQQPCPFLHNTTCRHYDHRPELCQSYPHLQKDGIAWRLMMVIGNCEMCPIVFNVYEHLKYVMGYKPQAHAEKY